MSDFIRARTPEQKAQRMGEIKAATAELFARAPYHEVTLTTIAEALGWSRGNLYKYITTKEEIFLSLYVDAFLGLIKDLNKALTFVESEDLIEAAEIIAHVSLKHKSYFRYQNLLPQVIETNVRFEKLVEFKRTMAKLLPEAYGLFISYLPEEASREDAIAVTQAYRYYASGLINTCDCAEVAKEAMRIAGMEPPSQDPEADLADFLQRLFNSYYEDYEYADY